MTGETFTELLTPHLQPVRRLVQTRLSGDLAEDALQRALLRAFAKRHQLRSTNKFKSWLSTIAINEVRMSYRNARPQVSIDSSTHFEFKDQNPSPYAVYEQREIAEQVRAGMEKLTRRDRNAIRLIDFDGMTARQAAGALGVSVPAFKSTHFRARKRLACALKYAA